MAKPTQKNIVFGKTQLLSAIAASAMLKPERLHIKELDGDVFVKRMTLGERDQYFLDMKNVRESGGNGNAEAFISAIVTEDGDYMFSADDLDQVRGLPPALTTAVLNKFYEVNRFMNVDADDTDEAEAEVKNS